MSGCFPSVPITVPGSGEGICQSGVGVVDPGGNAIQAVGHQDYIRSLCSHQDYIRPLSILVPGFCVGVCIRGPILLGGAWGS